MAGVTDSAPLELASTKVTVGRVTVIDGLVSGVLVPSERSVAVTVWLPRVLSVTGKLLVPEINAAFAGNAALVSEEVIPTVSVTELIRFQ